jgi:arylamine N-acetyltransferase
MHRSQATDNLQFFLSLDKSQKNCSDTLFWHSQSLPRSLCRSIMKNVRLSHQGEEKFSLRMGRIVTPVRYVLPCLLPLYWG